MLKIALFVVAPQFPSAQIRVLEPLGHCTGQLALYSGMALLQHGVSLGEMHILPVQREFPGVETQTFVNRPLRRGGLTFMKPTITCRGFPNTTRKPIATTTPPP